MGDNNLVVQGFLRDVSVLQKKFMVFCVRVFMCMCTNSRHSVSQLWDLFLEWREQGQQGNQVVPRRRRRGGGVQQIRIRLFRIQYQFGPYHGIGPFHLVGIRCEKIEYNCKGKQGKGQCHPLKKFLFYLGL